MDEEMFNKGKAEFESKGGLMVQDEDGDKYLDARGADAATLDKDTIIFRTGSPPTLSEYHEELIHSSQLERGEISTSSVIEFEIEAKRELVKNQVLYGIPDHENTETERQLEDLLRLTD